MQRIIAIFKELRLSSHKVGVSNYLVRASNFLLVIPKRFSPARAKKVRELAQLIRYAFALNKVKLEYHCRIILQTKSFWRVEIQVFLHLLDNFLKTWYRMNNFPPPPVFFLCNVFLIFLLWNMFNMYWFWRWFLGESQDIFNHCVPACAQAVVGLHENSWWCINHSTPSYLDITIASTQS